MKSTDTKGAKEAGENSRLARRLVLVCIAEGKIQVPWVEGETKVTFGEKIELGGTLFLQHG